MPAIGGVARRYRRTPGVDHEELMQEGVVGLLRAASRYDPTRGNPFWAYATWWVRQSMQQLVSEMTRPIVLSDRALRRLAQIKEARRAHTQANGSEPTSNELADATGLGRRQVDDLLTVEIRPRGLEEDVRRRGRVADDPQRARRRPGSGGGIRAGHRPHGVRRAAGHDRRPRTQGAQGRPGPLRPWAPVGDAAADRRSARPQRRARAPDRGQGAGQDPWGCDGVRIYCSATRSGLARARTPQPTYCSVIDSEGNGCGLDRAGGTASRQPSCKLKVPSRSSGYTGVSTQEQAGDGEGLNAQRTAVPGECERRG